MEKYLKMIKKETQTLFSMIEALEKIRDILRLSAPSHKLNAEQKAMFKEYLDNLDHHRKELVKFVNEN